MTPKFVPPRPAPGPEPWPPPGSAIPTAWIIAIAVLALAALAIARLRLRRGEKQARALVPPAEPEGWAAWSRKLRESLARRLGPQVLAATTEEIVSSPAFGNELDRELAGRIRDFLRSADRAQFDPTATESEEAGRVEFADLAERLAAGANSRTNGK